MERLFKETSYTGTPVSPADETPVVNITREEVTSPGNRRIGDDVSGPNPCGRPDADGVPPKASDAHLSEKRSSTKRRMRRKRRAEQEKMRKKGKKRRKHPAPTIRLGTWNVRTMTPGFEEEVTDVRDVRKTAVIDKELARLQIDIAALQETRLADSGTQREENYTFYWKGKGQDEVRMHGVGFAVSNKLLSMIEEPTGGSERLLSLKLQTAEGPIHLICVYAPTNCKDAETKDCFYDQLNQTISEIGKEQIVLLGDFNARVGADHETWSDSLGRYGIGKANDNGQRLLELCTLHKMKITNTMFNTSPRLRTSWRHPRSKLWHQLDLVITKEETTKCVRLTRTYHSADCDTDHSLVACTIQLRPKKIHRAKPPGNPRINVGKTGNKTLVEEFSRKLREALPTISEGSAEEKWSTLQSAIYNVAKASFGTGKNKSQDWFEANTEVLAPILKKKRNALLRDKTHPTKSSKQLLKTTRSQARMLARRCANNYWLDLSQEIQSAAETGNIRSMYEGIKKATGPASKKTAPLKDLNGNVILDKNKQMERWVEHYGELYSRETKVTDAALEAVETLPAMLELDELPTMDELLAAIKSMPIRKAPGKDGIPPELIKIAVGPLADHLLDLFEQCWIEGKVPQDMKDSVIVTIYKNKGDRSDCNNHRGISLMSIVGKCFARVVLMRLQKIAERVYPESQCGFRPMRSTTDMIFSVRQLQEMCREQHQPLYMAFIDLTKAFDLVSRDGLFKLLPKIGCPPSLLSMIRSFHEGMQGIVQYDGSYSESFDILSGVKQGCVMAPTLFGIFFALMLKNAFGNATEGIHLHTRTDGKLFNLSRLNSQTKTQEKLIREMLYADDAAVVAHSQDELQALMDRFATACTAFGLTISIKKTEVMGQNVESQPEVYIDNQKLVATDNFTYLGSTISSTLGLDREIDRRIGRACGTFAKLRKRVWENKKLTIKTKVAVYRACVLSTLLYGSETWATYATQEKRLNSFHLRHLRLILEIKWQDKVTNNEVLERAGIDSLYSLLKQRRLRWLGHVRRMEDGRLPKDLLYGKLAKGKRSQGRPLQCYRNVCKRDLRDCNIDATDWEEKAEDRDGWKLVMKEGLTAFEGRLREEAEERRQKRKERDTHCTSLPTQGSDFVCNLCGRECHSRIGLYSHRRRCTVVPSSDLTDPDVPLSTHSCPYCRTLFLSQTGLYSHLRTHHQHSVDWSCNGDDHSTVAPETSSDLTDPVVPLSTYSCPYCRILFSSQAGLYSHLRTHHQHYVDWSSSGDL